MKPLFVKLLLLLFLVPALTFGQVNLESTIGMEELDADDAAICEIPLYLSDLNDVGLMRYDTLFNFTLYSPTEERLNMEELLSGGKPVLMISGSYTCPVFRYKIEEINQLAEDYADELEVMIIYTVEAHPVGSVSPYFGFENVGNANTNDNIFYEQPGTYGERKAIASEMLDALEINVPVYLDDACNSWWSTYGPTANGAYLVDTNGIVFAKHAWFDTFPNYIDCDIESLLYGISDCLVSSIGNFEFSLISDEPTTALVGETIEIHGTLINNSDHAVEIDARRLFVDIPGGWQSALCTDICYGVDVDMISILLEPGEEQSFILYIYTDEHPGAGTITIGFQNVAHSDNRFIHNLSIETQLASSNTPESASDWKTYQTYPSLVNDFIYFQIDPAFLLDKPTKAIIYNTMGQAVFYKKIKDTSEEVNLSHLMPGNYFCVLNNGQKSVTSRFVKI